MRPIIVIYLNLNSKGAAVAGHWTQDSLDGTLRFDYVSVPDLRRHRDRLLNGTPGQSAVPVQGLWDQQFGVKLHLQQPHSAHFVPPQLLLWPDHLLQFGRTGAGESRGPENHRKGI